MSQAIGTLRLPIILTIEAYNLISEHDMCEKARWHEMNIFRIFFRLQVMVHEFSLEHKLMFKQKRLMSQDEMPCSTSRPLEATPIVAYDAPNQTGGDTEAE